MLNFYIKLKSVPLDVGKRTVRKSFPRSADGRAYGLRGPGFWSYFSAAGCCVRSAATWNVIYCSNKVSNG